LATPSSSVFRGEKEQRKESDSKVKFEGVEGLFLALEDVYSQRGRNEGIHLLDRIVVLE